MESTQTGSHSTKSFTRLDNSNANANTTSYGSPEVPNSTSFTDSFYPDQTILSPGSEERASKSDVFASRDESEDDQADDFSTGRATPAYVAPSSIDELPIEVKSLTERFLDSLSAKVYPSPLTVDALSQLYQEFYLRAAAQIGVHIAALSTQLSRQKPLPKATTSRGRRRPRPGSRQSSVNSRRSSDVDSDADEQQMLTATEVADRKRARKLLEVKRVALEEAVERAVCEKLYNKIWRHRSTEDEERDQKLSSRIAALSLVGIGFKDLLESAEADQVQKITAPKEAEIREWLVEARAGLQRMSEEKYPLGKLRHLKASHKSIVDTLSRIFPASSSADEILPTLIFTLITASSENLTMISDLHFIQRFRANSKIDGETAYCLVNLEAAITFVETVDLTSLSTGRAISRSETEESLSRLASKNIGISDRSDQRSIETKEPTKESSDSRADPTTNLVASQTSRSQNRLSNLFQAQTNRIEAASDAVRESILDSADQAFDTINSTLENSFKFLFGRIRDQQTNTIGNTPNVMPKTLEDARKLVSSSVVADDEGDITATNVTSDLSTDIGGDSVNRQKPTQAFIRDPVKSTRDRSIDSNRSGSRGRRIVVPESKPIQEDPMMPLSPPPGMAAVESMRNFGNSINPLNRFANMGMLPRFGRSNTNNSTVSSTSTDRGKLPGQPDSKDSTLEATKESKAVAALDDLKKTNPPIKRYLEMKDAQDIKIGEVEELLKDYQRLAASMRAAINSI